MGFTDGEIVDARYRVIRKLSDGGMGSVFHAVDTDLERDIALKILLAEASTERERLRQEAVALAKLRHDNVVSVYGFGGHKGRAFIAMEFVAGRSLAVLLHEHLMKRQHIPHHRGLQILAEAADGLAAVHGAGLIHRDVKLANIVVEDRTGRVVLVDFGAAIVRSEWDERLIGTAAYLAPELRRGERPTPRSDIYALGCTAFELLTGRLPYFTDDLEEMRRLHEEAMVPRPSGLREDLKPVDELIMAMLAKEPSARPGSASAVSNRLVELMFLDSGDHPIEEEPIDESVEVEVGAGVGVEVERLRINILVVDDDPLFARVAARCAQVALSDQPVLVSRAANGARALEKAAKRRPDLVVLDYLLPDMNGVEVLSRLRAMREGFHSEVVVASGALGVNEQWRFGILGVQDFISKPVEFATLVKRLHEVARRRAWTQTDDSPLAAST